MSNIYDFGWLAQLPTDYAQGQERRRDQQLREEFKGGLPRGPDGQIDFSKAAEIYSRYGNPAKSLDILSADQARRAAAERDARDFQHRQTESDRAQFNADRSSGLQQQQLTQTGAHQAGQLDLARQTFDRKEEPEKVRILRASGIDPQSPAGHQALYKLDEKLTATDRKAIHQAEDENAKFETTISSLKRAKELNPHIFTGWTASMRGNIGTSNLPGANVMIDKAASEATAEWDQIMTGEAIKSMSETLKGASTDFEMRKFIAIAADTSKPPKVREAAMDRALQLVERQKQINQDRTDQLRGGTYYKPGGGQSAPVDVRVGPPLTEKNQSRVPPPPPGFQLVE